jgi:hypothetical protein
MHDHNCGKNCKKKHDLMDYDFQGAYKKIMGE